MQKAKFLNKEKVVRRLSVIASRVKRNDPNIKKIVLFGSLAKDTYTLRSDADLLIIIKNDTARFIDRIPKFSPLFIDVPVPVEVFPYTERESKTVPLARKAAAEGIVLA